MLTTTIAPDWFIQLEDYLFRNLAIDYRIAWRQKLLFAIDRAWSNKQWISIRHKFHVLQQEANLAKIKELYAKEQKDYQLEVIKAIEQAVAYHKHPSENARSAAWSAAGSAARSAASSAASSAAWSAADSAAYSAAYSAAWLAARLAARSAAASAVASAEWSAAGSAAYSATIQQQADMLLEVIKQ